MPGMVQGADTGHMAWWLGKVTGVWTGLWNSTVLSGRPWALIGLQALFSHRAESDHAFLCGGEGILHF